jgi:hypothetical protein
MLSAVRYFTKRCSRSSSLAQTFLPDCIVTIPDAYEFVSILNGKLLCDASAPSKEGFPGLRDATSGPLSYKKSNCRARKTKIKGEGRRKPITDIP